MTTRENERYCDAGRSHGIGVLSVNRTARGMPICLGASVQRGARALFHGDFAFSKKHQECAMPETWTASIARP